jgi:hypothetical protein
MRYPQIDMRGLSWKVSDRGVRLISHPHVKQRFKMNGSLPPPPYAFMACYLKGETTLQLIYMYRNNMNNTQQGRKILWDYLILPPQD